MTIQWLVTLHECRRCQVGLQMDSNIDPETKETEGRAMGLCPPKGLRLKISGLYHFPWCGFARKNHD